MMMDLIGMHFVRDEGESYNLGEIVGQINSECCPMLVVQITKDDLPCQWPLEVIDLCDLSAPADDEEFPRPKWYLFRTTEERDAWVLWMNTPDEKKLKVIELKPGRKEK